jgi:hypothetical protein
MINLCRIKARSAILKSQRSSTEGEIEVVRDSQVTDRLRNSIEQIRTATTQGELQWERQLGSAHRYARLNDNLLILGPTEAPAESTVPRYLFITAFNSPDFIEVNSNDADLGDAVLGLTQDVEVATKDRPPTDPFAIDLEMFRRN